MHVHGQVVLSGEGTVMAGLFAPYTNKQGTPRLRMWEKCFRL
jgi:hypothetical protein